MKTKRLLGAVLLAAPLVVLAAACEITVYFWEGSDSSVQFEWWVDGAAADSATCSAVGGTQVRMSVSETDGAFEWWDDFYWPCSAGSADTGLEFTTGSFWFAWQLIDTNNNALSATGFEAGTLGYGSNDLGIVNFLTSTDVQADLEWAWTIEDHAWDDTLYEGLCPWATGDVTTILLLVDTNADGTADETWEGECGWGAAVTPETATYEAGDTIQYRFQLVDSTDFVWSEQATWDTVTLVAGANDLGTVDFDLGDFGPLDVLLQWGDKLVDPAYGDCDFPPSAVTIMGYLLQYSDGTVADVVDIETDPMTCTTDLSWLETNFDDYDLILDGEDSLGTTVWGATCTGLLVDSEVAGDNSYECDVLMTAAP